MHILPQSGFKEVNKRCVDCSTTRTPPWRGGPAGLRSLCNACGIRYRKKKRAVLGLNRDSRAEKSKSKTGNGKRETGNGKRETMLVEVEWKSKLSLREEEQAAFLLMALSCGYVQLKD
ncbi:hypothetical protein REPUB_Repub12eG0147700 [Reevesia pubescens]